MQVWIGWSTGLPMVLLDSPDPDSSFIFLVETRSQIKEQPCGRNFQRSNSVLHPDSSRPGTGISYAQASGWGRI